MRPFSYLFLVLLFSFPLVGREPFYWGVSNSAFQVEGSPVDSDWNRWAHTTGKIKDNTNADKATDFWNRYREDFQLAKNAGLNSFRMSIAWERIETASGQWDEKALAHYEEMIRTMRSYGLEPMVTLHHYALPVWVADKGGLLAPDFDSLFARYAAKVVERLSTGPAHVVYWMTFNEPMILVRGSYLEGNWPPGIKDPSLGMKAAASLAKAHIAAVASIREAGVKNIKMSIAKNWAIFHSGDKNPLSRVFCKMHDWVFNRQFMKAITTGKIFFWMPGAKPVWETVKLPPGGSTIDYVGINNYGRWIVKTIAKPPFYELTDGPEVKSDLGWEIYPQALYESIQGAASYGYPVFVSENGIADKKDGLRPFFLTEHFDQIKKAIHDGYPVIGYLYWSLTDNFEWSMGLTPRFGLIEMDYDRMVRKPRPSYYHFKQLVEQFDKTQATAR